MSDRTSHRRRARQNRSKQARAGIVVDYTPVRPVDPAQGLCDLLTITGRPCPKVGNHLYVKDDGDETVVMCDEHHDDEGALLREFGGYAEDLLGVANRNGAL